MSVLGLSTKTGDYLIIQSATSTDAVFNKQIQRSQNLTEHFLYNEQVRIGLIIDSDSPQLSHSLDQRKSVLSRVLKSARRVTGSNIPQSLKLALDEFKRLKNLTKKKNLIIMLDSKLSRESDNTINLLKSEGVKILFVIYGNELGQKNIKDLGKKGNVLIDSKSSAADNNGVRDIINALEGVLFYYHVFL